ncbi:MAG: exo-alpha-sialidase [Saprospiraceae bacterium]|nr:exo-alpha-sialidase [Saprospiraceae bacterium]
MITIEHEDLVLKSNVGGEPNLYTNKEGEVFISWVEYTNDTTDVLYYSKLDENSWTDPVQVSQGNDWFVNWADFPSISSFDKSKHLVAHWLRKSDSGTYDYDINVAISDVHRKDWDKVFTPHRDSIPAEHGFVSMKPRSEDRMFITWLDGRNTKGEAHQGHHQHAGAMTLRAAEFDQLGHLYNEAELDSMVCDCCQTGVAMINENPIVVYRNRTKDEIRDIYIVRQVNDEWQTPVPVFQDNWKIAGCPVNGPAIDSWQNDVAVVWYSMKDGQGEVKIGFSKDGGSSFSDPILVDDTNPLGRVDILYLKKDLVLITWISESDEDTFIYGMFTGPDADTGMEKFVITQSNASRQSGFPRITKDGKDVIMAWTEVDSMTRVRTRRLKFKN